MLAVCLIDSVAPQVLHSAHLGVGFLDSRSVCAAMTSVKVQDTYSPAHLTFESESMFLNFKKYGLSSTYDSIHDPTISASTLPLDPIECAGCLNLNVFEKYILFVCTAIVLLTEDPHVLFSGVKVLHGLHVSNKYNHRKKDLIECGILAKENRGKLRCLSTYFEVPKERFGTLFARIIFNGRSLSEKTIPPEVVNLPEIPDFLDAMARLHQDYNRHRQRKVIPSVLSADLRHWFHEIPVSVELSSYFGIAFDDGHDETYRWRTLPMGWSHSPRIAQCLSWGLILQPWKDKNGKIFFPPCLERARTELKDAKNPPAWIYLYNESGEETGIMTVWYDNVICAVWNNDQAGQLTKHLHNASRVTNCQWKEINIWSPGELMKDTIVDGAGVFLGIQLAFSMEKRSRTCNDPETKLLWRHAPKKLSKWFDVANRLKSKPCRRDVASGIGLLVWNNYISLTPLLRISTFLNLCKTNAPGSVKPHLVKAAWLEATTISADDLNSLQQALIDVARTNEWRGGRCMPENDVIISAASDASDDFGGWVLFSKTGNIIPGETRSVTWHADFVKAHIFLKELMAGVLTVEHIVKQYPSVQKIQLAVDNTAAAFCLRRMYSNNHNAVELLTRLDKLITEKVLLKIVTVRGVDNAADCPSRRVPLDPIRNLATWNQLVSSGKGRTHIDCVVSPNTKSGVRHEDEDDNDDIVCMGSKITVELLDEMEPTMPMPQAALSDAAIHQYLTGSDSVPTG